MSEKNIQSDGRVVDHGEDEIKLFDVLLVILENKGKIAAATLLTALLAAGATALLPDKFQAEVLLLPPKQAQNTSALLMGQLSSLGGSVGGALGPSPNDMYIGMLQSRTIADALIRRFDLVTDYRTKDATETRLELAKASTFINEKSGMITLQVLDKDKLQAAALANGYIEELQKLVQVLAVTEAAQRRQFYEKQLAGAKRQLSDAEVALKKVQQKTGLIQMTAQAEALIQGAAAVQAQVAAHEITLTAMKTFATTLNPDYVRVQQELIGLRAQLSKMETGVNRGNGDLSISASKAPEDGLEYVRKLRDVKYYETIFDLMAKQFEMAKIDEAKESAFIQVLDPAIPPDNNAQPHRVRIVIIAALMAAFFSMCWAFASEALKSARRDINKMDKMKMLKRSLLSKSMAE